MIDYIKKYIVYIKSDDDFNYCKLDKVITCNIFIDMSFKCLIRRYFNLNFKSLKNLNNRNQI